MNIHEYLIKSAAAKTKALDNHPVLKGKQKSALPDKIQAMIIKSKMQKTAASKGQLRRAKKIVARYAGIKPQNIKSPKARKGLLQAEELIRRHEAGRRGSKYLSRDALMAVTGRADANNPNFRLAADSIALGEAIKRNPGAGIKKVTAPSAWLGEGNTAGRAVEKIMGKHKGIPEDAIFHGPGPNDYPQKLNAGMEHMKKNMLRRGVTPQQRQYGVTKAMEKQFRPDKVKARLSKRIK